MERTIKRMEVNDAEAINTVGCNYRDGRYGFTQDYDKALELWHRAGELCSAAAYCSIGFAYLQGRGVEVDKKKAIQYWELAAMGGSIVARHNLGSMEMEAGNMHRGLKHWIISVRGGYINSLSSIKVLYSKGHATKDDYTKALQSYQAYLDEIKSDQRDKAAAAREEYRYY